MDETIPVACTLTTEGLATQAERWRRLMARAMTERAPRPQTACASASALSPAPRKRCARSWPWRTVLPMGHVDAGQARPE